MKKKGSITVFLALMMTCFFSAVFALLEAARVSGLKANTQISTFQAVDTVMASYNREVWKNYHLMFWKAPDGDLPALYGLESLQQAAVDGNRKDTLVSFNGGKNYYMLQVHLADVTTVSYQLATDDGGAAFRSQAAEMMKETMGEDALSVILDWIKDTSVGAGDEKITPEEKALNALDTLESAVAEQKESKQSETSSGTEKQKTSGELAKVSENPLTWVKSIQKKGIYTFLFPEEELSDKSIDLNSCIGKRNLETGNLVAETEGTDMEKLLFRLYLNKYFLDASEDSADHTLDYELEYLIVGKSEDSENLKGVVRRLILLRETANLAFLETNPAKQQEASAIAAVLSAAVGQPELEPLVKQGILAAWAYAEALSDVQILLNDGKVSMVKTEEQWHTDIFHLSATVSEADAKQQTKGLSYSNYLQLLMWTMSDEKLSQRGMDMIEKNTGVKMDQMICRASCEYVYETSPLFWNFVTLGQHSLGTYQFKEKADLSFLDR